MIELTPAGNIDIRDPQMISHIEYVSGVPGVVTALGEFAKVTLPDIKSRVKRVAQSHEKAQREDQRDQSLVRKLFRLLQVYSVSGDEQIPKHHNRAADGIIVYLHSR